MFNTKAKIPSSSSSNMHSRTKDLTDHEESKVAKEETNRSSSMDITALMHTLHKLLLLL